LARKLKELRQFERGMYGQADGTDIPDDAAAICVNTEPEAPYGTIRGIAQDSAVFASLSNYNDFDVMKVLKDRSGTNDLIGVDFSNNEVGVIADYDEATRSYTSKGSISHSSVSSIETVNNQAFIGLGNTSTTIPQWVGKVNKGQFGDTPPSGYQIEDAALTPPKVIEVTFTAAINIYTGVSPNFVPAASITLSDTSELPNKGVLIVPVGTLEDYNYIALTFTGNNTGTNTLNILWPEDIEDEDKYPPSGSPTIGGTNAIAYYMEVGPGVVDSSGGSMVGVYNPTKTESAHGSLYDTNASVPNNFDGDNFEENSFWGIGVSYIYDGYKESPIKRIPLGHYWFGFGNSFSSWEEITFKFFIQGFTDAIATASSRVTAIKFYINVTGSENDGVGTNQINSFRLLEQLNIAEAINSVQTLSNGADTIGYQYNVTAGAYEGDLYIDESGLSEYQSSSTVYYSASCQHNSQLFAANVYNPNAADENWTNYIVRSVEFAYDTFNWTRDYLVMPNPIKAIVSHSGRVYAFDEYNMYRINPDQLYIEDIFNGLGCSSQQALQSTEYALFIANDTGVHMYDGRSLKHISTPVDYIDSVDGTIDGVVQASTFGYKACAKNNSSFKPLLSYDSDKMCLVVYGEYTAGTRRIWLYKLDTESWFVQGLVSLQDSVPLIKALAVSASNSVIASYSDGIYELFRGSTRKLFSWVSKKLNMDLVTQEKKFRKIYLDGNDIANINALYSIDGSAYSAISSLDSSSTFSNGKWIQIKASSTNNYRNTEVDHIGIVYRDRLFVK
jgi:hypothetical protein